MKSKLLFVWLMLSMGAVAQNVIVTKNLAIEGQIVGVTKTNVKCKFPNGQMWTISTDTIEALYFASGIVQRYANGAVVSVKEETGKPDFSNKQFIQFAAVNNKAANNSVENTTSGKGKDGVDGQTNKNIDTPRQEPNFDIIVLTNSTRINAVVLEETKDNIKYRLPNSSVSKVVKTSEVMTILYHNGETSVFLPQTATPEQTSPSASVATQRPTTVTTMPEVQIRERSTPSDIDFPTGGRHTDENGNTRVDFAGGHKTTYADGSTRIEVPFVTIKTKGGGRGVDMPQCDDVSDYQTQSFYAPIEDHIIITNRSSNADCFRVAVCSVIKNHYIWRNVCTTPELKSMDKFKSQEKVEEVMNNEDRYVYSVAVKSRSGRAYSFKIEADGDDLKIDVFDYGAIQGDW